MATAKKTVKVQITERVSYIAEVACKNPNDGCKWFVNNSEKS